MASGVIGYRRLKDWRDADLPLFAVCRGCGRQVCLIASAYVVRFGEDKPFWRIMKRLRCTVCRSTAEILSAPTGPTSPNLMEVFDDRHR